MHKATPPKSLRATWKGSKCVSVNFYARGADKTQVSLQHGKLPDGKAAERVKRFWQQRLAALARLQAEG